MHLACVYKKKSFKINIIFIISIIYDLNIILKVILKHYICDMMIYLLLKGSKNIIFSMNIFRFIYPMK